MNLLHDPWIICKTNNGVQELSIIETFAQAENIVMLDGPFTEQAAILRLLLAIAYRNPNWAEPTLQQSLKQFTHRFELTAWMQIQDLLLPESKQSSIARLFTTKTRGSNRACGDERDDQPQKLSASHAARAITTHQSFALEFGVGAADLGSTIHGSLSRYISVFALGQNLRDTILLNLMDDNSKTDRAYWEQTELTCATVKGTEVTPLGYADMFTWQSQALKLNQELNRCACSRGVKATQWLNDPHLAYNKPKDQDVLVPAKSREHTNFSSFAPWLLADQPPRILEQAARTAQLNKLPYQLLIISQRNNSDRAAVCENIAWRIRPPVGPDERAGMQLAHEMSAPLLSASLRKTKPISTSILKDYWNEINLEPTATLDDWKECIERSLQKINRYHFRVEGALIASRTSLKALRNNATDTTTSEQPSGGA